MKSEWLPYTVLRAASLLAPSDQRVEWLDGWRSGLWYIPRRGATLFCLGAFHDALWLRRNNPSPVKRTRTHLESPLRCLALLAILAAVSSLIAVLLPGPQRGPWPSHLGARDLPAGCIAMLLITCLLLPATRLAMGLAPANRHPVPWPNRLRRGIFLALKIALVQPIMLSGFVVLILVGPVVPMAPQLGMFAMWILVLRWVLIDQHPAKNQDPHREHPQLRRHWHHRPDQDQNDKPGKHNRLHERDLQGQKDPPAQSVRPGYRMAVGRGQPHRQSRGRQKQARNEEHRDTARRQVASSQVRGPRPPLRTRQENRDQAAHRR